MRILNIGCAGFIGSAAIRHVIENTDHAVINIDKLTCAGNLESLAARFGVIMPEWHHAMKRCIDEVLEVR